MPKMAATQTCTLFLVVAYVVSTISADFVINVVTDGNFSIGVNNDTWLHSGPFYVYANGKRYSTADKTLKCRNYATGGSGLDKLGPWQDTNWFFDAGDLAFKGRMKTYQTDQLPLIIFSQHYYNETSLTRSPSANTTINSFPSFYVRDLKETVGYLSYGGEMMGDVSKKMGIWGPKTIDINGGLNGGPLVLFDKLGNTVILQAFSNFMAVSLWYDNTTQTINCGIMGDVNAIPAGFEYSVVLYYGTKGINKAFEDLGSRMRYWYGKTDYYKKLDITHNYLGYWTDNASQNTQKIMASMPCVFSLEDVLTLVASDSNNNYIDSVQDLSQDVEAGTADIIDNAPNVLVSEVVQVVSSSTTSTVTASDIDLLARSVGSANNDIRPTLSYTAYEMEMTNTKETADHVEEVEEDQEEVSSASTMDPDTLGRSRKRKRDPSNWVKSQRKRNRQAGMEYTNTRGHAVPRRRPLIGKDCVGTCRFKCTTKISPLEREQVFQSYWCLSDDAKNHFYNKTVGRMIKKRERTRTGGKSRRKYSYSYFVNINDSRIRVCKEYYLSTLSISQRRISYYFEVKHNPTSATPGQTDLRGKSTKERIPKPSKDFVRKHIASFPRIESHYCRSKTKREYLEQGLTLTGMYRLYLEKCEQEDVMAVKNHVYRTIFNTEFNLGFHSPKKDRCDKCEEFRVKEEHGLVDDDLRSRQRTHLSSKVATKEERDKDRQSKTAVVCFDLENVISCPRAQISSFFYRRKLNVFNLTAHCSIDSSAYCAVWTEKQAGRGANGIESALVAILEKIHSEHHPRDFILLSDSCVSQNRNSGIIFALKDFMRRLPVCSIEHKFCEPGHSYIQEVDCIHSRIEKQLQKHDIFSPPGVIKCLKRAWSKAPTHIIQMRDEHFKKYMDSAKLLNMKAVPFTKLKSTKSVKDDLYSLSYKTSFTEESTTVSIRPRAACSRMSSPQSSPQWPSTRTVTKKQELTKEKVNDLKAMLKFMSPTDKRFMNGLIS